MITDFQSAAGIFRNSKWTPYPVCKLIYPRTQILVTSSESVERELERTLIKIGDRLIELRKRAGYTSHETFAFDHDLPRVQYWRLESGKSNFTLSSLVRVLSIHDISVEEFFATISQEL